MPVRHLSARIDFIMEKGSKTYELGYLVSPLVAEEKITDEVSILRNAIEKYKGMVLSEEVAKMRRLAYTIKKPGKGSFESAYFGWIKFIADSEFINEIKKDLEKDNNIIRFTILDMSKEDSAIKSDGRGKISKRKKITIGQKELGPKVEIKTEEIDKKLEEIIGV